MPDEDPGDVFLHRRAVVLDALLSDPVLTGPSDIEEVDLLDIAGTEGDLFAAELPHTDEAPSAGRDSGGGPKASERILALLNGDPGGSPAALDFSAPTARAPGASDPEAESSQATRPAEPAAASAAATWIRYPLRDLLAVVRRPKVALAICAALVVLLVVVLVLSGGGQPPERPTYAVPTQGPVGPAPTTSVAPTTPAASTLTVKSAQSHCPAGGTPGLDAFVGPGKAWSCPRAYRVDGQVLTIDLGGNYTVESIGLVPGWDAIASDGADQWPKFRTASRVSYQFDDPNTTVYTQQTLDQRALVVTTMKPPVRASRIVLTVVESKGDAATNIVALSSIVITGH
ncbi:discoidin domain-containing protein [Nocardia tengchongensis]|uniref:discoidin domain-containing protein n=1 Tax=Nocardia tengchongensis TaxID=2055889 RepID=UPI0036BDB305